MEMPRVATQRAEVRTRAFPLLAGDVDSRYLRPGPRPFVKSPDENRGGNDALIIRPRQYVTLLFDRAVGRSVISCSGASRSLYAGEDHMSSEGSLNKRVYVDDSFPDAAHPSHAGRRPSSAEASQ